MAEIGPTRSGGFKEALISPATTGSLSTEAEGGGREKANVTPMAATWHTPNRKDKAPANINYYLSIPTTISITTGLTPVYYMRAYHNVLLGYVSWQKNNSPDTTGANSGYTPSDLKDIVVVFIDRVKL